MRYKSLKLIVGLAMIAFLITVISSGRATLAQEVNEDILGQDQIGELCGEVAGVEVLPDGSLGKYKACDSPLDSSIQDGCGEIAGVPVHDDGTVKTPVYCNPPKDPSPQDDGCNYVPRYLPDDKGEVVGIPVCEQEIVVAQGVVATSSFTYNGEPVDPKEIPLAQGSGTFVDNDFDGLNDVSEAEFGFSDENGFDWLDHHRDCVIDAKDAQAVAFRWNTPSEYDPYFDRDMIDGVISPGNGFIDISDLQMIYGQYGLTCGPQAVFYPTAQNACNQLAIEASDEGVDNFYCSTSPLPAHVEVQEEGDFNKIAQVKVHSYRDVEIKTISNTLVDVFYGEPAGGPPANVPEGEIASYHSAICKEVICTINANASWSWRILGLTCAEFTFFQSFKIYYPWRVVIDVTTPIAGATSSAPCSHSNLYMNWDDSDLPFSSSLTAGVDVQAGVPFFGSLLTFRSWSFGVFFSFDGHFNTETIITD